MTARSKKAPARKATKQALRDYEEILPRLLAHEDDLDDGEGRP